MKKIRFSRKYFGIPYAVFLLFFVIFPLLLIVKYAFTDSNGKITLENFVNFFKYNANLTALFTSLGLAICTTIICIVLAYPVAYILSKRKGSNGYTIAFVYSSYVDKLRFKNGGNERTFI